MLNYVNHLTMYRLMTYYLRLLVTVAAIGGAFGILSFSGLDILLSALLFSFVCWIFNMMLGKLWRVPINYESPLITGVILALIAGPLSPHNSFNDFMIIAGLSLLAMISKYVLVWRKQHIFNPAALAVAVGGMAGWYGSSWWVGQPILLPLLLIGGCIIVTRLRRWDMVGSFFVAYGMLAGVSYAATQTALLTSFTVLTLAFFASVMLIEPATAPGTTRGRMLYGSGIALVLWLLQTQTALPSSLEMALLIGNLAYRLLHPTGRIVLRFKDKEELAPGVWQFSFAPSVPVVRQAGQYVELTLPHPKPDARGVRRYFTIASAPQEKEIFVTTRISEPSSTFKQQLLKLKPDDTLMASPPVGDFVLPQTSSRPLVLIAGGIGITPYRAQIASLLHEKRSLPLTLIYSARTTDDLVFTDLFAQAEKGLGLKTVYVVESSGKKELPHVVGRIDTDLLKKHLPHNALVYISGPEPMVEAVASTVRSLGIPRSHLHRDFFSGYTN